MTTIQALILGVVQGITEFLPISSSGHLVIIERLFGIKESQLVFDIFLHLGTLAAVLIYFRKDIMNMILRDRKLLGYIIIASIPTFFIGFFFKDAVEEIFAMPHIIGYMLMGTGIFLIIASLYGRIRKPVIEQSPGFVRSLIVGTAQGIAVMPGISRSGSTIVAGILSGFDKEFAFRFSFLMSIPAILGASILKMGKIGEGLTSCGIINFSIGGIAAMIVGLISISLLKMIIRINMLYIFGIYCIFIGYVIIIRL